MFHIQSCFLIFVCDEFLGLEITLVIYGKTVTRCYEQIIILGLHHMLYLPLIFFFAYENPFQKMCGWNTNPVGIFDHLFSEYTFSITLTGAVYPLFLEIPYFFLDIYIV